MTLKEQYVQDYINRYYQTKKYVDGFDFNRIDNMGELSEKFESVLSKVNKYIKNEVACNEAFGCIRQLLCEIDDAIKEKINEYIESDEAYKYGILSDYHEMESLRQAKSFFLHLRGLVIDLAVEREEPPLED